MRMNREMIVMGPEGDTKHTWDVADPDEAKQARELFDLYKRRGYAIFESDGEGGPSAAVTEFNPSLGCLVMVPLMAGG
jgi:hypothetical protein